MLSTAASKFLILDAICWTICESVAIPFFDLCLFSHLITFIVTHLAFTALVRIRSIQFEVDDFSQKKITGGIWIAQ